MEDTTKNIPDDEHLPSKTCPLCGGTDIRLKFPDTNSPIRYCIDCMVGRSQGGAVVDMHVFESCNVQHDLKSAAPSAKEGTP